MKRQKLSVSSPPTALNAISWDMHDILKRVSSCSRKRIWGDLQTIPLRVSFSHTKTKLDSWGLNIL